MASRKNDCRHICKQAYFLDRGKAEMQREHSRNMIYMYTRSATAAGGTGGEWENTIQSRALTYTCEDVGICYRSIIKTKKEVSEVSGVRMMLQSGECLCSIQSG
jgi:hypothetical protein